MVVPSHPCHSCHLGSKGAQPHESRILLEAPSNLSDSVKQIVRCCAYAAPKSGIAPWEEFCPQSPISSLLSSAGGVPFVSVIGQKHEGQSTRNASRSKKTWGLLSYGIPCLPCLVSSTLSKNPQCPLIKVRTSGKHSPPKSKYGLKIDWSVCKYELRDRSSSFESFEDRSGLATSFLDSNQVA
jgi:hypothetical protein